MLLIMDNAEHLLTEQLFVEILQHAPRIKVLVTSRESLNLREEWAYEVKGLALPASEVENIEGSDAVALFVQCARRAHAGFRLTDEDRAAAVRLCQLVEGVPLGIELAAAWMRTLELADIVREIERSLDFLNATWRDLPERHRSLRAVFDHSWNMLSPEEQTTLSRLTPFHGGFHRQAAEQVAQASLPVLASLVAKSIIHRRGGAQSARSSPFGRYEMHELIRHYAEERMVECGQCDAACQAHFHYFFAGRSRAALTACAVDGNRPTRSTTPAAAFQWSLKPIEPIDDIVQESSPRGRLPVWKRRDH
jgi:predicted ATPase